MVFNTIDFLLEWSIFRGEVLVSGSVSTPKQDEVDGFFDGFFGKTLVIESLVIKER